MPLSIGAVARAQGAPGTISAPIAAVGYHITIDSADAAQRKIRVSMTFTVASAAPVLLALPAWTPGSYELTYWARNVSAFAAVSGGKPLAWDKVDYQTWRVRPAGAGPVSVSFEYRNDSLDNSNSWSQPDFALLNGATLFLYPAGRPFDFPSTLELRLPASWRVATGMTPSGGATFTAPNYHDLVDMPIVAGHFDFDSTRAGTGWLRFASYPASVESAPRRAATLSDLAKVIGVESAVFGETPWHTYTVMQIADSAFGAIVGLEHQNSHVDLTSAFAIGQPVLTSVYAHEIFHAWNVKRLRPADMWPYEYAHEQPTTWLWMSEGVTDYYADVALVRSGVIDSTAFLATTAGKIGEIAALPPFGLDDASLSAWIHPTDGTADAYYPKGSLAGLMLDILIRDASNNAHSLDDVMRGLYRDAYKAGKGFTGDQWWKAVQSAAGGKSFADFEARYVDGREPYPWSTVLPLAGLQLLQDSARVPVLGVTMGAEDNGMRITGVAPGSTAEQAGVQPGDDLVSVGDIPGDAPELAQHLRVKYGNAENVIIPITVIHNGKQSSLAAPLQFTWRVQPRVALLPGASAKAVHV
ncbi:MAG: M61 family metallopeptidase, partial [Gemmatimonadaceae bacterium]|nr:M61 family metallopeptidase [Gemmatimonadaceae bacterium]